MSFFVKKEKYPMYKKMLWITLALLFVGLIGFISASLGTYTKSPAIFKAMMMRHVGLGVFAGLLFLYLFSLVDYRIWKKYALFFYIAGIVLTLLVFVPGLGMEHGGAKRWISLGFISFQPAEILKFTTILFVSSWMSSSFKTLRDYKKGLLPLFVIIGIAVAPLIKQPDTGSLLLISTSAFLIYFVRAPLKHIGVAIVLGGIMFGGLVYYKPYIIDRFETFFDPSKDPNGSSYQIRQSRIAIGAGGLYGRGVGQSVQKFGSYLPESNSDSVFAVFAEEWGFIGSLVLIILYLAFAFLGLRIVWSVSDPFAQNLALGIVLLIVIQVFLNIAAISGVLPLSGMPLIFMSNGGTALLVSLSEIGILLNISRFMNKKVVNKISKKRL